jgi:DNA-binding NarL/FixJ family response regulator
MVRILIADTQEFARSRLRKLIEAQAGWELVAEAGDGKDAISKAADIKPDVAVLAYSLPVINGIEAAREIRVRVPDTAVLISMLRDDEVLPEDVLRAGARGYILKTASQRELLQAIVAVGHF